MSAKKYLNFQNFLISFFILIFTISQIVFSAPEGKIIAVSAQKNVLTLKYTGGLIKTKSFFLDGSSKDLKRFVVDFENANLTVNSIINSNNLQPATARINQFSTKPLIVRLVISGPKAQIDSFKILSNINGKITIGFTASTLKLPTPIIDKNSNLIQEVKWTENDLKILGSKPVSLSTSEGNNKKIIFDILNANFAKKDLGSVISVEKNKTTEEIRVAQFQPKIVRVVIEGPEAQLWKYKTEENNLVIFKGPKSDEKNFEIKGENKTQENNLGHLKIIGDEKAQIEVTAPKNEVIKYKTFRLHSPERLVLDLYSWDLSNPKVLIPSKYSKSLIINVRTSKLSSNSKVIRIVFDLSQKGISIDDKLSSDKQKLILSLNPLVSESMKESLKELRKVRKGLKVVIDAGHGGYDSGATYSGIEEKNITLSMTKQLKEILLASKIEVIQTRKDDQFISLDERVNITRKVKPDLFVSIHCNAMQSSSSIRGIETYYFTPQSRSLAHILHKKVVAYTKAPNRYVRKARFVVIRETAIPSVLVETGFLSNPSERNKLIDKDYQTIVVKALAEGILDYLSGTKTSHTATLSKK